MTFILWERIQKYIDINVMTISKSSNLKTNELQSDYLFPSLNQTNLKNNSVIFQQFFKCLLIYFVETEQSVTICVEKLDHSGTALLCGQLVFD